MPAWNQNIHRTLALFVVQPVLDHEVQVVALVEDLAAHVRVQLAELPHLAVLLGDEALVHRGDLDVDALFGKVEVGRERANRGALLVPFDGKRRRLVVPLDVVEVEEARELPLALVSEVDRVRLPYRVERGAQGVPTSAAGSSSSAAASADSGKSSWIWPCSSCSTGPTAMPNTPWPRWKMSTTSSGLCAA